MDCTCRDCRDTRLAVFSEMLQKDELERMERAFQAGDQHQNRAQLALKLEKHTQHQQTR